MPDISMCENPDKCEEKGTCYRNLASPSRMQAYASFFKEGDECLYYWPVGKEEVEPLNNLLD